MIRSYTALFRSEPRILLFGALCSFLSSPGQTYFIALFVGSIGLALGLGSAQLGAIYLAATMTSAMLLPSVGHLIDRVDLRNYLLGVVAGLALACAVVAAATGPVSLFAGLVMLRLFGQGLMTHVEVTSIARYFTVRRGRAVSLTALGLPLATATLPTVAVMLIAGLGWRLGYLSVGAFLLIVAAPVLHWLIARRPDFTRPPQTESGTPPSRALDGMRIVGRTRFFWLALPILLYMPFTSTALTFHIEALAGLKGWSREMVALAFAGFAVGHACGLLGTGGMVDRFGARTMLPLMNLPMIAGIALYGWLDPLAVLFAFLVLLGISTGMVQTTMAAVWAEVFGVARLGTIRSFAVMLMVAGTAAGPAGLGVMLDAGLSVGAISAVLCGYGLSASALSAWSGRGPAETSAAGARG